MGYYDYVFDEAEAVRKNYGTSDPFTIINEKCIELKYFDFEEIKGFYYVQNGYRVIALNSNLDSQTKRIVAAHELGHDVLHRGYAENFVMNDIALYGNSLKIERQANDFAANLLLSDDLVWNEFINDELGTDISSVTIYPKQLLYYKFSNMKKRGFKIPDRVISSLEGA